MSSLVSVLIACVCSIGSGDGTGICSLPLRLLCVYIIGNVRWTGMCSLIFVFYVPGGRSREEIS